MSVTSYKVSIVVGKPPKPLHIFNRAGSRQVPEGLHIGISHVYTPGAELSSQELHSPLEKSALFRLELQVKVSEASEHIEIPKIKLTALNTS